MSNRVINSNRHPASHRDGSSRASHFAPQHTLGQQHPDRAQELGGQAWLVASYLVALGILLLQRTSPELWLQSLLDLAPTPWPGGVNGALLAGGAILVVAIGASYRPLGGLLGFGALPLPALALMCDATIASLTCFLGSVLAAIVLRRLSKRDPHAPRDRRGRHRILLDATNTGIATLLAAITWTAFAGTSTATAVTASTAVWIVASQTLDRLHRSRSRFFGQRASRFGVLWDALGWVLAASLAVIIITVGVIAAVPLLIGFVALIAVGSSRELDRTLHLKRIRDLRHVGSMAQRLVPTEQASELASQCLDEVKRTVDFTYFELRFESSGGSEVFSSRAHGPLSAAPQEVPAHPAAVPGIHTRRSWLLIERDLLSRPVSAAASATTNDGSSLEPPQRLGKLRLWIDPRNQSDNDEELIHDLVPQIAALIDRSRLDREARQDALTGLARRHVFDRELARRFKMAREDGHAVALLLFDLDHFKQVNDNYGHDAGDRVLEAVGAILLRAAEPGGLACRWGGEELALLQWGGGENALHFADELRAFIAEQLIQTDNGPLSVTTSVGVSAFPDLLIQEPEELVKLADEALYAAKERGRNRALLANGRGRFRGGNGEIVGSIAGLDPELIPQL